MSPSRTTTVVEGRHLTLSNPDKVLYPEAGFTKGEMLAYYVHVAPALLPHLRDRPLTMRRFPDGVAGESFYEKHVPRGTPEWVGRASVPRSAGGGQGDIVYPVVGDLPSLVWAANLAAIELHVPMWRAGRAGAFGPVDTMVFDLDPGEPATVVACCEVARWLRAELGAEGHEAYPKTSGSKGLQLYVPVVPNRPWKEIHELAHAVARGVESAHGGEVTSTMSKAARRGKVLIDWSQNHAAKTTVAPYSLRARPTPTVSTPVTWDEVDACASSGDPGTLVFSPGQVLDRVERHGDLFAAVLGPTGT